MPGEHRISPGSPGLASSGSGLRSDPLDLGAASPTVGGRQWQSYSRVIAQRSFEAGKNSPGRGCH
jgi:hypothetical protein